MATPGWEGEPGTPGRSGGRNVENPVYNPAACGAMRAGPEILVGFLGLKVDTGIPGEGQAAFRLHTFDNSRQDRTRGMAREIIDGGLIEWVFDGSAQAHLKGVKGIAYGFKQFGDALAVGFDGDFDFDLVLGLGLNPGDESADAGIDGNFGHLLAPFYCCNTEFGRVYGKYGARAVQASGVYRGDGAKTEMREGYSFKRLPSVYPAVPGKSSGGSRDEIRPSREITQEIGEKPYKNLTCSGEKGNGGLKYGKKQNLFSKNH